MLPPGDGTHAIWTKATNAAHYKVYADRAAAIAWFNGAQVLRGDNGAPSDTPVAATDSRYADVDKKVADIWAGFVDQFAADTQDLPMPIVILVESSSPGGYAVFDPDLGLSPNVFMIQTPSLTLGDDAVRGMIAHELAHHVLKHKWPGVSDKIEKWYDATKTTQDGFGLQQANDKALKTTGDKAQLYGSSTGDYPATQWNGWARPGGSLEQYVTYMHDRAKATNAGPCDTADTALEALAKQADSMRDSTTSSLSSDAAQLAQLDTLSKDYVAKETTCTSVVTGSFFKVIGEALGESEADIRKAALPDEIEANDTATSAYDALVRLAKKYDGAMLAMDLKNLRYYSYEEQADDVSIGVLKSLGQPGTGIVTFLQQGLLDAAARTKCDSLIAAGEPPYGVVSDAHHSRCWRVWHGQKLNAFLK